MSCNILQVKSSTHDSVILPKEDWNEVILMALDYLRMEYQERINECPNNIEHVASTTEKIIRIRHIHSEIIRQTDECS